MDFEANSLQRAHHWYGFGLLAWVLTCLGSPSTSAQVDSQIRTLTGVRTRLVWSQDQTSDGPNNDPLGLDDNHRLVFVMHDMEGYTHREIADAMGKSIRKFKSATRGATDEVKRELDDVAREVRAEDVPEDEPKESDTK